MATHDSITPFPADIDRNAFGHWLSGFTDGEGHFGLRMVTSRKGGTRRWPRALFTLRLRADDGEALKLIQSFWRCGTFEIVTKPVPVGNEKPQAVLAVERHSDLAGVVVPHFDRYPLYAKKSRDFGIWKEAVSLCCRVRCRKLSRGARSGFLARWHQDELEQFEALAALLKGQRKFETHPLPEILPTCRARQVEKTLFDSLDG